MCGIVGVIQYKSKVPRDLRSKALRILFSDSMYYTQTRGSDATGVYQVHTDGDWMYAKEGEKVSKWMFNGPSENTPAIYRDFLDSWEQHPHDLTAVVGHCRKATIGSMGGSNVDNHPFAIQVDERNALLGCHNGTLKNHETIFSRLPEGLERQGKTDSEIIFHFMWHLTEQGQVPFDGKMIETLGKRLDGAFACVVVNTKFPNIVATMREGRPMDYVLIAPLNVVVAISEKKFMVEAIENYDRFRAFSDPSLPALNWDDRILSDRDYRIFDTEKEFPVCTSKPNFQVLQDITLDHGAIRSFNHNVEEEWRTPKKETETTTSGRSGGTSYTKPAQKPDAKVTKKITPKLPAKAAKNGDVVTTDAVVIVPAGEEEEAARAFEEVRSLGLCPAFSDEKTLANVLGMTSLDNVPIPTIATALSKTLFRLGYAVSRADQRLEVQEVRRAGRELAPKLETAISKQKKAQQHIWTHKQLLILLISMARKHYGLAPENVQLALRLFPGMGRDNQDAVMGAFNAILGDKGAERSLNGLLANYTKAEENQSRKDSAGAVEEAAEAAVN